MSTSKKQFAFKIQKIRMNLTVNNCISIMKNYGVRDVIRIKRLTKGYANVNYWVKTSSSDFLLKIYLNKSLQDIQYEMRLLEGLKEINFPAAYPVKTYQKEYVFQTGFEKIVIFNFLVGKEPDINAKVVKSIASAAAKLNSITEWQIYERIYPLHFNRCIKLVKRFSTSKNQYLDFFQYFEKEVDFLREVAETKLPIGLIHGDIFPDNTLFENNQLIGLVDFEFAGTTTLLTEIGVAINGFCFVNNQLDSNLLKIFLTEYNKIRKIQNLEQELLWYYIELSTLIILRWHLNHIMIYQSPKSLNRVHYLIQRIKQFKKLKRINFKSLTL